MHLKNVVRQIALLGIGMASIGKETAEKIALDISREISNLSEEEGKRFVEELIEESKSTRENLEVRLKAMMKELLAELEVPSREDIEPLKKKVSQLEARVAVLEQKSRVSGPSSGSETPPPTV